jgi:hypothetical protein
MTLHRALTLQGLHELTAPGDVFAESLGNDCYDVTFRVRGEGMAKLIQVLAALSTVGEQIYTQIDRAHIRERADEKVRQLRQDQQAIAKCYWEYRDRYKHRDCIAIAHEKVSALTEGRRAAYSKTDIGYCVRAFPLEYFQDLLEGPEQELARVQ